MKKSRQRGLQTKAAMNRLFVILSVPFLVAVVFAVDQRVRLLNGYTQMETNLALFEEGAKVLLPLADLRDVAPIAIHSPSAEVTSRFAQARARTDRQLDVFLGSMADHGAGSLADQAQHLASAWGSLTVKTGLDYEDVIGPFENVNQIGNQVVNALTAVLFISDISISDGIEPAEVLSVSLGTGRALRDDVGLIRALALYVSSKGGYLGGSDALQVEKAWQRIDDQIPLIDAEVATLVSRTGDERLAVEWEAVRNALYDFLHWAEESLILPPRITLNWERAYQSNQAVTEAFTRFSDRLITLAEGQLAQAYRRELRNSVITVGAIVLLYIMVVWLVMLLYRSNYRAIGAQAESEAKGQFLARMSHEIRTPLNGVIGMAELLRETELTPQQQEYINLIDSAGRTLSALVNDVLDFAKIEAGKVQLVNEPFDLVALIEECGHMFNLPASDNGNLILIDIDPSTPKEVRGDAVRLRQILINLLGNAVKFTHYGRIVLSVGYEPGDESEAAFTFEVKDTGIGLSEEEQARLFEHFNQASASTSREYGGTGLGLAISRELVLLMGSDITLNSAPGMGAAFSFTLTMPCTGTNVQPSAMVRQPAWLWDMQGNLRRWMQHDERFGRVLNLETLGPLWSKGDLEEQPRVLLINGLPARALLEEALQRLKQWAQPVDVVLLVGIRTQAPVWLPKDVRLVQRSVLRVDELQTLLTGLVTRSPSSLPPLIAKKVVNLRKMRVLIAEDNPVNQLVTRGYLERLGIVSIHVCENGAKALREYRTGKGAYDLVLMDLDMPVMDGLQCARSIRELEQEQGWAACTILAVSAHVAHSHGRGIEQAGMNGQLIKPLSLDSMRKALEAHLPLLMETP